MIKTYTYAMVGRPFSIACQPVGHIDYIETNKSKVGYFGKVIYDRELSQEEIYKFELRLLEE